MSKEAEGERRRPKERGDGEKWRRRRREKRRRPKKSGDERRKAEKSREKNQIGSRGYSADILKETERQREKFGFRHSMSSSWRVRETNRELGRDLGRELDGEAESVRDRVQQSPTESQMENQAKSQNLRETNCWRYEKKKQTDGYLQMCRSRFARRHPEAMSKKTSRSGNCAPDLLSHLQ